jgi:hypothetical protein
MDKKRGFGWLPPAISTALLILISGLLFLTCLCSCGEKEKPVSTDKGKEWKPEDYFPITPGMSWSYQIEVKDREPVWYRIVLYGLPGDKNPEIVRMSGRFLELVRNNKKKTFLLEKKITQHVIPNTSSEKDEAIELEIGKDELGVYKNSEKVFWHLSGSNLFYLIHEIVVYHKSELVGPLGKMSPILPTGGFGISPVFVKNPLGILMVQGCPEEQLLFKGFDYKVPKFEGEALLHFIRYVIVSTDSEEKKKGHGEERGFYENLWYAKGKGLVRLEQKIGEETSMVWTLQQLKR